MATRKIYLVLNVVAAVGLEKVIICIKSCLCLDKIAKLISSFIRSLRFQVLKCRTIIQNINRNY